MSSSAISVSISFRTRCWLSCEDQACGNATNVFLKELATCRGSILHAVNHLGAREASFRYGGALLAFLQVAHIVRAGLRFLKFADFDGCGFFNLLRHLFCLLEGFVGFRFSFV